MIAVVTEVVQSSAKCGTNCCSNLSPRGTGAALSNQATPRAAGWTVHIRLLGAAIVLVLFSLAVGCGGGSSTPPPTTTSSPTGPTSPTTPPALALGSVTVATPVSCANENGADQGAPNGTCYDLTISCPNVADEAMGVKLNTPTGASKGTVLFTTGGGGGPNWYDQNFTYGTLAVQDVVNGGFTTAQLNFWENPTGFPTGGHFAGWLTGPGGPLALACRWATAAQWVHDNIANNTAFCATGNSGGSGAAAYAISHYGMGPVFNFLEETSGPPYARIDKGCTCDSSFVMTTPCSNGVQFSECYQMDGNLYIDPAYDPTGDECSSAEASHSTTNDPTFLDDSIMGSNPLLSYPNTDIHFVFGDLDTGSADPQAMEWINMITAKNGVPTVSCVADAPHMIADVQDGATTIANDIIASCHQ